METLRFSFAWWLKGSLFHPDSRDGLRCEKKKVPPRILTGFSGWVVAFENSKKKKLDQAIAEVGDFR